MPSTNLQPQPADRPSGRRPRTIPMLTAAGGLLAASLAAAAVEMPDIMLDGDAEAGRAVAMDRARGNCIACHWMPNADSPGTIGPALVAMQTRFPSKEQVAAQIWDPTVKNPDVVMPPFGKHGILSHQEFVDVVEYIWSL